MSERLAHGDIARPDINSGGTVDVEIVLVTFGSTDELDEYQAHRGLDFPVLRDPERSSYRAFGLGRASRRTVWGLATLRRYADILSNTTGDDRRAAIRGFRQSNSDTLQLGGDFVIDPTGRLAWGFWSTGPADRPDADDVADAVIRASTA